MKSCLAILAVAWCGLARGEEVEARLDQFQAKVKPLLDSRCVSCHGPDKVKGGLRLDSREALLKGGDSGPAVLPGNPEGSLLLQAVMHKKKDLEMPPKEKLTSADIEVLARWIRAGVRWVDRPVETAAAGVEPGERIGDAWSDQRNPIVRIFGGQRLDLWSLKPVTRPAVPRLTRGRWARNPIDGFVWQRLDEAGLKPSPEASRRVLARRLFLDLTGLPPTPEEMAEYLGDRGPGAYERLVDRLLESPRYGEHAARQWLDVIRYSDSNGFDWDEFRPRAWRFRDYVIRSFNADKPFDRFIREQLAGDELLEGPPKSAREQDLLIATGYLRLGPQDNSAPLFNEQARSRAELMSDLVETTGSAFLGLTLACCRCHDHKFDPLSQADHYRMRAFFEGVKYADDLPLDLAEDQKAIRKQNQEVEEQINERKKERRAIEAEPKERLRREKIEQLSEEERVLLAKRKEERSEAEARRLEEIEKKIDPSDKEIESALSEKEKAETERLAKEIETLKEKKEKFTLGLLMTDAEGEPSATKILYQGDYKAERDPVTPGFISALDPNPAAIRHGANPKTLGRRLTLADWIASDGNPLTARVIVNRVWQSHFGEGLVATPNDFGLAGARPSHPELLDFLAGEFMREGWSLKKLHRLIVTSSTYKQVSSNPRRESPSLVKIGWITGPDPEKVDAENKLLWRQNLRRLSAEQLRDSLLEVSGMLRDYPGGPPVWPELPQEVLVANPAFLDDNAEKTKGWYPSPAEKQGVRSIFLVQKRTVRVPFMETFDLPENATSCPRRTASIVAPQALSLLNGPLALEAARNLAARVAKESGDDAQARVRRAFALAFQRPPEEDEQSACVELLQKHGLLQLCRALLNANEFVYFD